jgi:prephenate dehydrogenase
MDEVGDLEPFRTVAILGVGLIGGSIGLALRSRRVASEVVGIGRDRNALEDAVRRGAVDRATTDLREGAESADVVVVCTPVNRVVEDVRQSAEAAGPDVLITDAGSSKRQIVEGVERQPRCASVFVGAHPVAGSERRGVAHARADLFEGRPCVLTPTSRTPSDRLRRAGRFWTSIGCRVLEMGPAEHDEVLAYTSHLPHALAAALAGSIPADWLPLAAGAYRDGTRVAGADTGLWTAIFRDNRGPLLKALDSLRDRLASFQYALMTDDEEAIRRWWDESRQRRAAFDELSGGASPPGQSNDQTC